MKPLICIPSPRDIPDFQEAIDQIQYPKLVAKYFPETEAYQNLRDLFLDTSYTHMVIIPDDLVLSQYDFSALAFDVEQFDLPVLAGTCRLSYNSNDWITAKKLDPHERFTSTELFTGAPIKKVEFDGLACTFIRRDVIEDIEFKNKSRLDFEFAQKCQEKDIQMHVDSRVVMTHLANRKGTYENWGVGQYHPCIQYH